MHGSSLTDLHLLSLRAIEDLASIAVKEDRSISIGAMATFASVAGHPSILQHLPFLAEAALAMGGPQIRNVATIGGNLCNGAVSADSAPMLMALNATLVLASRGATRTLPIHQFYAGPGKVHRKADEILSAIQIAPPDYEGMSGCYIKYSVRKAMDIANLGVAAVCQVANGVFTDMRIALGVAAPTPIRCTEAEAYALNRPPSSEVIAEIGRLAVRASQARDSWRASKAYREHLIQVLTVRTITTILHRKSGKCCHGTR